MAELIAGVELGGTKCIAVLAESGGTIVAQHAVRTDTPDGTLGPLVEQLLEWKARHGFAALGIASFGPIDLDPASPSFGSITSTAKPGWRDTPVLARLAEHLEVPVAFDTDVNGAAIAEGRWGAARGLDDYAYVTVGTGVGVGLIVNGRPTRGLGHCEAGHMRVARPRDDRWPGACPYHGDCVEGLAAGPAIAARAGAPAETLPHDHPAWEMAVDAVAQMLQALTAATGPRRFLLGGGVLGGRPDLLAGIDARVRALIGGYLALPAPGAFVTAPGLGAAAGPLGPIALALSAIETGSDAMQAAQGAHDAV